MRTVPGRFNISLMCLVCGNIGICRLYDSRSLLAEVRDHFRHIITFNWALQIRESSPGFKSVRAFPMQSTERCLLTADSRLVSK